MSIWKDIHQRSTGESERMEDYFSAGRKEKIEDAIKSFEETYPLNHVKFRVISKDRTTKELKHHIVGCISFRYKCGDTFDSPYNVAKIESAIGNDIFIGLEDSEDTDLCYHGILKIKENECLERNTSEE